MLVSWFTSTIYEVWRINAWRSSSTSVLIPVVADPVGTLELVTSSFLAAKWVAPS